MQFSMTVRRLWNTPAAVITVMAALAVIAISYDISTGVVSFALMAQSMHTINDIGIFAVFERGFSNGSEKNEGVWGIVLGMISYALILTILPFASQGVGTGLVLPALSIGMMVLKIQYFLIARGRDRTHAATIGAGAHVLGDVSVNAGAVLVLVLAPILRDSGVSETDINRFDAMTTVIAICIGFVVGVYGIFRILRNRP